jgi:hypothetical protein
LPGALVLSSYTFGRPTLEVAEAALDWLLAN